MDDYTGGGYSLAVFTFYIKKMTAYSNYHLIVKFSFVCLSSAT